MTLLAYRTIAVAFALAGSLALTTGHACAKPGEAPRPNLDRLCEAAARVGGKLQLFTLAQSDPGEVRIQLSCSAARKSNGPRYAVSAELVYVTVKTSLDPAMQPVGYVVPFKSFEMDRIGHDVGAASGADHLASGTILVSVAGETAEGSGFAARVNLAVDGASGQPVLSSGFLGALVDPHGVPQLRSGVVFTISQAFRAKVCKAPVARGSSFCNLTNPRIGKASPLIYGSATPDLDRPFNLAMSLGWLATRQPSRSDLERTEGRIDGRPYSFGLTLEEARLATLRTTVRLQYLRGVADELIEGTP